MAPATMTPAVRQGSLLGTGSVSPQLVSLGLRGIDVLQDFVNRELDLLAASFPLEHVGSAVAIFDTASAYRQVLSKPFTHFRTAL
jgi:hypothetical protein